jgi:hypothetical protein
MDIRTSGQSILKNSKSTAQVNGTTKQTRYFNGYDNIDAINGRRKLTGVLLLKRTGELSVVCQNSGKIRMPSTEKKTSLLYPTISDSRPKTQITKTTQIAFYVPKPVKIKIMIGNQ